MRQTTLLFVGDFTRAEFAEARSGLSPWARVIEAADVDAAATILAAAEYPVDVVVVAQAYPGQFTAEAIDVLRGMAPLARIAVLLGSWCEGETRTGQPWPAAIRVYGHQWQPRLAQELARLSAGQRSSWTLPMTASEEERTLAMADSPLPQGAGRVLIWSGEPAMQEWLCAACRRGGYSPLRLRAGDPLRVGGARAAVFDGTELGGEELEQLKGFTAAVAPSPLLVLLNFPRLEDRDRARAAGAAAVLSKPVVPEDLLWHLQQAVQTARGAVPGGE